MSIVPITIRCLRLQQLVPGRDITGELRTAHIRYANTVGLDVGSEWGIWSTPENDGLTKEKGLSIDAGYHTIKNNTISDNGLGGMFGLHHYGNRIEGNVVERNNRLGFRTWEMGAIKLHHCYDAVIEGNLIRDNDAFGVWLDNRYRGTRVSRNVIVNNMYGGVNVEMGLGPALIDNNIIAYTRHGSGFYSHDASGVTFAHNCVYANAIYGVNMTIATDRKGADGKLLGCSNNVVANNIIISNKTGAISMPYPWERATENICDHNILMGAGEVMDEGNSPYTPLFMPNPSHWHLKMSDIAKDLKRKLNEAGIPDSRQPTSDGWQKQPFLELDQWQVFMGMDRNSRLIKLYHESLGSRVLEFVMNLDGTLWELPCLDLGKFSNDMTDFLGLPYGEREGRWSFSIFAARCKSNCTLAGSRPSRGT